MDGLSELLQAQHIKIKRLLGRGGFAAVYQGTYGRPGYPIENVAVKVLQAAPDLNAHSEDESIRMFLREATCTKQQYHKHIIRCYGVCRIPPNHPGISGLTKTTWAMVLELAEAQTTKSLIVRGMTEGRRTYTNLQAYEWLTQIASALTQLHANWPRVIHRDIKQENVLLKREKEEAVGEGGRSRVRLVAKLADLGLHVVLEDDRSVMLRGKSRNSDNRSVHRRISQQASSPAAVGGFADSESPFFTVTVGPSEVGSRAASVMGDDDDRLAAATDVVGDVGDIDTDKDDTGDDSAFISAVGNVECAADDSPWRVGNSGGSSSSSSSSSGNSAGDITATGTIYGLATVTETASPAQAKSAERPYTFPSTTSWCSDAAAGMGANFRPGTFQDTAVCIAPVAADCQQTPLQPVERVRAVPLLPDSDDRGAVVGMLPLERRVPSKAAGGASLRTASAVATQRRVVSYNGGYAGVAAGSLAARPVTVCGGNRAGASMCGASEFEREARERARTGPLDELFQRANNRQMSEAAPEPPSVVVVELLRPQSLPAVSLSPRASSAAAAAADRAPSLPLLIPAASNAAGSSRSPARLQSLGRRSHQGYAFSGTPPRMPLPILEDYSFIGGCEDPNPGQGDVSAAAGSSAPAGPEDSAHAGGGGVMRVRRNSSGGNGAPPASSGTVDGSDGNAETPVDAVPRPGLMSVGPSLLPPSPSASPSDDSSWRRTQLRLSQPATRPGTGRSRQQLRHSSSQHGARTAHKQALSAPASQTGLPPSGALEQKESIGMIISRNPDLVKPVGVDASLASGLRRVGSLLSQFRQNQLQDLRSPSIEWVFGLTGRAGSCMYMAPEVFRKLPYNEKVDVFSFAVLMYELLSREVLIITYFNTSKGDKLGVKSPEDYAEKVCEGYRPPRPACLPNDIWSLIEACWHDDPVQRPSMEQVLERLTRLRDQEELNPTDPKGMPGCVAGCTVQ